jgi:tape measure domain-containing protein
MADLVVGIRLTADGDAFVGGLSVSEQALNAFAEAARRASRTATKELEATESAARQVGTTTRSAGQQAAQGLAPATTAAISFRQALGGLAALAGVSLGIEGVRRLALGYVSASDALVNFKARLDLVTGSADATARVQARLFDIAQQSRVSFLDLGQTYTQIARASQDIGISQDRLLNVTTALSQAITISGGSAASTQAAMIQLSQGLASGTLRGEELNSILEQTPRVAQAIAEGMGVGVGQLRRLGEEGAITARAVVEALERSAPKLAAEFAKIRPTVSGAFQQMGNSAIDFVGEVDRTTGASSKLAESVSNLAKSLTEAKTGVEGFVTSAKPIAEMAAWAVGGVALARALQSIAAVGVGTGMMALLAKMGGWLGGAAGAAGAVGALVVGAATADDADERTMQAEINAALRTSEGRETGTVRALRQRLDDIRATKGKSVRGEFGASLPELAGYSDDTSQDVAALSNAPLDAARRAARAYASDKENLSKAQKAAGERLAAMQKFSEVARALRDAGADDSEIDAQRVVLQQRLKNIDEGARDKDGENRASALAKAQRKTALEELKGDLEARKDAEAAVMSSIAAMADRGVVDDRQRAEMSLETRRTFIDEYQRLKNDELRVLESALAREKDPVKREELKVDVSSARREVQAYDQERIAAMRAGESALAAAAAAQELAMVRARAAVLTAARASAKTASDELAALRRADSDGVSIEEARFRLAIDNAEQAVADAESRAEADQDEIGVKRLLLQALRAERDARREIAIIEGREKRKTAEAEADAKAIEDARQKQERMSEDIGRSLTDSLLRSAEAGEGAFVSMRNSIVGLFRSMVLRPLIEPIMAPVAKGISDLLGGVINAGLGALGIGGAPVVNRTTPGVPGMSFVGDDLNPLVRRAMGGPVLPGQTVMVGEEGPEVLRMGKVGGTVTPNPATVARMGGAPAAPRPPVMITQHFNFAGSSASRAEVLSAAESARAAAVASVSDLMARGSSEFA